MKSGEQGQVTDRAYSMAPEYLRIPVLLILGSVAVGWMAWRWGTQDNSVEFGAWFAGVGSGASLCLGTYLWSWRIRIDGEGVWRRRLWRWELFPWGAFQSGSIERGVFETTFIDSSRPWHSKTLELGFISKGAQDEVLPLLAKVMPTGHPVMPARDEFELKKKMSSERWKLSPEGIEIHSRKTRATHHWESVSRIVVKRLTHQHSDFRELEIQVPGEPMRLSQHLNQGQLNPNWKGAKAAEILALLHRHLNEDVFFYWAMRGEPRSVEEVEKRIAELQKEQREMTKFLMMIATVCALMLIGGIAAILEDEIGIAAKTLSFALILGPMVAAVIGVRCREHRRRIERIQRSAEALEQGWREECERI